MGCKSRGNWAVIAAICSCGALIRSEPGELVTHCPNCGERNGDKEEVWGD